MFCKAHGCLFSSSKWHVKISISHLSGIWLFLLDSICCRQDPRISTGQTSFVKDLEVFNAPSILNTTMCINDEWWKGNVYFCCQWQIKDLLRCCGRRFLAWVSALGRVLAARLRSFLSSTNTGKKWQLEWQKNHSFALPPTMLLQINYSKPSFEGEEWRRDPIIIPEQGEHKLQSMLLQLTFVLGSFHNS